MGSWTDIDAKVGMVTVKTSRDGIDLVSHDASLTYAEAGKVVAALCAYGADLSGLKGVMRLAVQNAVASLVECLCDAVMPCPIHDRSERKGAV